jgi:hypothetical protein
MRIISGMLFLSALACAPEPTSPADTDLGGVWTATAHLYTLSNFRLEIVQESQGIVSGKWSAKRDGDGTGCQTGTLCDSGGDLIGRNSVSQVEIQLFGAGRFEGVLIQPNQLRGIYAVNESYDIIVFNRTSTTVSIDRKVHR